eukprot:COSAG06_NODE_151_length_21964_cov_95.963961_19_plen_347_part_00
MVCADRLCVAGGGGDEAAGGARRPDKMGKGMGCGASKSASVDVPKLSRGTSAMLKAELIEHLTQTVGIPAGDSAVDDYVDALHTAGYSTVAAFAELTVEELCETYSFKPYHATLVGRYRKEQSETTDDATDGSGNEVRAAESRASGSAAAPQERPRREPHGDTIAPLRPGGDEPTESWLHQKDGRIVLGKGNDMLSKILASVNLITIFGAARTGKSTLMSLLCGEQGLFRSSAGGESFTQGIMIANFFTSLEAFSSQDGGECVSPDSGSSGEDGLVVGFVDAEGQGDKGMQYDLKLISTPLLFSSIVLFNWKGGMQKHEILVRQNPLYLSRACLGKSINFLKITSH